MWMYFYWLTRVVGIGCGDLTSAISNDEPDYNRLISDRSADINYRWRYTQYKLILLCITNTRMLSYNFKAISL